MNKILLIIKREYLSRVKKKSFILMTILGPILMAGIMVVPIWLAKQKSEKQKVEVIDESFLFKDLIPEKDIVHFDYPPITLQQARDGLFSTDYDAILWIPPNVLNGGNQGIQLLYKKQLGMSVQQHIEYSLNKMLYEVMLAKNNVNLNFIKDAKDKSTVTLKTIQQDENGKEKNTNLDLQQGIGFAASFMIYLFIFLYGVQVMRGVMEEKTSRIVEVMLSSVKPFQLMMGKIIGIAMVGLTQFLLWIVLSTTLYSVAGATILNDIDMKQIQAKEETYKIGANLDYENMGKIAQPDKATEMLLNLQSIDIPFIVCCFLFYFLGAYLFYSAIFAAVGAAVDNEADTQQFMLPITIPLVLGIFVSIYVISNPSSNVGFWFSMIPFTSPVVMMARLPFGVPTGELVLSMILLVISFIIMTWLAGRIYRTGILMYGKKVSWKELGKWLFYRG